MQNGRDAEIGHYKSFYRPQSLNTNPSPSNSKQHNLWQQIKSQSNVTLPANIDRIIRHVESSMESTSPGFGPIRDNTTSHAPMMINNIIVNPQIWKNYNEIQRNAQQTTQSSCDTTPNSCDETTNFNPIRRRSVGTRPNSVTQTNTHSSSVEGVTATPRMSRKDVFLAKNRSTIQLSTPRSQRAAAASVIRARNFPGPIQKNTLTPLATKQAAPSAETCQKSPLRVRSKSSPKVNSQTKATEAKNATDNDAGPSSMSAYDNLKCSLKGLFYRFKPSASKMELRKLTSDVVDEILKSGVRFDRIVRSVKKNSNVKQLAPVATSTPKTNLIAMKELSKSMELRRLKTSEGFLNYTPINDKRQPKPIARFTPVYFEGAQRKRQRSVSRDPRAQPAKRSKSVDIRKSAWFSNELMEKSFCNASAKVVNRRVSLGHGLFTCGSNGKVFSF